MKKQRWPELWMSLDGIDDDKKYNSEAWITYPNGAVDFLGPGGVTSRSICIASDFDTNKRTNEFAEFICEIKPHPIKKKWKPKIGDIYYYASYRGKVARYVHDGYLLDKYLVKFGNCFKTREEAEIKLEKIKKILNEE